MSKVVLVATSMDVIGQLATSGHGLARGGLHSDPIEGTTTVICAFEARHASARFLAANHQGVTVLPGMHDPEPIGPAIAALLPHVKAEHGETMRAVALRLHRKHGPMFHPDT